MNDFVSSVNKAGNLKQSHIQTVSDVNLPGYDWKFNCLKTSCYHSDIPKKFVDALTCNDHSLTKMVSEPTRVKILLTCLSPTTNPISRS